MHKNLTIDQQNILEHLRRAYEMGMMTHDAVSDALERQIDFELAKHDSEIDANWLDACMELMKCVDRAKLKCLPNHSAKNLRRIRATLWRSSLSFLSLSPIFRCFCYVACLVIVTFGVTITVECITTRQSSNGQIYQLTGSELSISSEITANAETTYCYSEFETADCQELCLLLGYTPSLPTWCPEGWSVVSYYVLQDTESLTIDVAYLKEDEPYILGYTYKQIDKVSNLSVDFFQDCSGQYRKVGNDKNVYFTTNMGQVVAVWLSGNSYSCISGPITIGDAESMILSIK